MQNLISEFKQAKVWAVVGATDKPEKFGYRIFKHLLDKGKQVFPINPRLSEIEGIIVYKSLAELPEKPEVVDLVVPPAVGRELLKQCAELGIFKVWAQPGAESPELVKEAGELGIALVYDACAMREV